MKQAFGQPAEPSPGQSASSTSNPSAPAPTVSGTASATEAPTGDTSASSASLLPRSATCDLAPPLLVTPLNIPPQGMPLPSMEALQLKDIRAPHPNDVLCGRGGGTNNHCGNEKFRDLVNAQKVRYLHSSKRDKPYVSRGIVHSVRAQVPPGRFLQKDESTGLWYDIGDHKAREKTSQALREGAPDIRREITTNLGVSQHHIPFPPPPIGPTAPVPAATTTQPLAGALLSARQAGAPSHSPNQFDPVEMERHMRHIRLAESTMLDKTTLVAVAAAAAEKNDGSALPTTAMSRVVSGASSAGLAAPIAAAMKEADKQGLLDARQPTGASTNSAQFQQVMAAAAAAGMPFPTASQLHLAGARSNLFKQFQSDNAQAAAVRAAGFPSNPFAGLAAAASTPPSLTPFPSGLAAAARAQGLSLFGTGTGQFPSPGGPTGVTSPRLNPATSSGRNSLLGQQQRVGGGGLSASRGGAEKPNPVVMTNPRPSVFGNGQKQRFGSNGISAPPPLTEDMALRLVFAETVSQKTANGTIAPDMIMAEKNSTLYLDAGLLGIDPNDMTKYLEQGHSEEEIVEHHYVLAVEKAVKNRNEEKKEEAKQDGQEETKNDEKKQEPDEGKGDSKESSDSNNNEDNVIGQKRPSASPLDDSERSLKKAKLEAWLPDLSRQRSPTEKRIHDALRCIGALS